MRFGDRLRQLRLEKDETQRKVAEGINISERVYGYYETGDRFPNDEKVHCHLYHKTNVITSTEQ